RDVPIGADAQDLQVDPARLGDLLLVPRRGGRQVLGGTVGTVDGLLGEVHASRDLRVDDIAVALRVVGGDADVFVEHERLRVGEGQPLPLVAGGELIVDAQRARTGRQPEDGGGLGAQQPLDRVRGQLRQPVFVGDDYFHRVSVLFCVDVLVRFGAVSGPRNFSGRAPA